MSYTQLLDFRMIFLDLTVFKTPTPCLVTWSHNKKPGVFHLLASVQKTKSIYINISYQFFKKFGKKI